ncbi:hypothetical protein ATER59S_05067 [Aquamicrobium terrae]
MAGISRNAAERVDEIKQQALARAARQPRQVVAMAKVIAEIMEEMHGGRWSIDINHKTQFVMIAQDDFGRRTIRPKRGEAV